jgi:hypothetical protein
MLEKKGKYTAPKADVLGHFWIDALYINQNDIPEKSLQVRRMKDIYEGAKKVVIWFGPAENDSDFTMDMIKYLAKGLIGDEKGI